MKSLNVQIAEFTRAVNGPAWVRKLFWLDGILLAVVCLAAMGNIYLRMIDLQTVHFDAATATQVVSRLFAQGSDLYQHGDLVRPYSLLYGPLMFIPGALMDQAGLGVRAMSVVSLLGVACVVSVVWTIVRRLDAAAAIMASLLWPLFMSAGLLFEPRMDSWWVALPCLAAVAAMRGHVLAVLILCAVATNIKLHSALYFLPLLVYCAVQDRRVLQVRKLTLGAVLMASTVAVPFFVSGVGLSDYVAWILRASHHKFVPGGYFNNVAVATLIIAPALTFLDWRQVIARKDMAVLLPLGTLVICALIACVAASKVGAGGYHLIPFIGSVALLAATGPAREHTGVARLAVGLLALWVTVIFAGILAWYNFHQIPVNQAKRLELDEIAHLSGGYAHMTIAPGDMRSKARNLLIHAMERGSPYMLTDVVMWDMQESGLNLSETFRHDLVNCTVRYWVVGAGEMPFSGKSFYNKSEVLMPIERDLFQKTYHLEHKGKQLDLWSCSK
jgi:hypothetical protein